MTLAEDHLAKQRNETAIEGDRKRNLKRGHCAVCDFKCHSSCEQCGTYLCIETHKDREMNCFKAFNTVKKYRATNPNLSTNPNL